MKNIGLMCAFLLGVAASGHIYADTVDCQKIKKSAKRLECFDEQSRAAIKITEVEVVKKTGGEETQRKNAEAKKSAKLLWDGDSVDVKIIIIGCSALAENELSEVIPNFKKIQSCIDNGKESVIGIFNELKPLLANNKEATAALIDWFATTTTTLDGLRPESHSERGYSHRIKTSQTEFGKKTNYLSALLM